MAVRSRDGAPHPPGELPGLAGAVLRIVGTAGFDPGPRRAVRRGASHVPRSGRPDDVQRAAPRRVQLLHAAAARDVGRRRGTEPVAATGRRCLARRTGRRFRRRGGHAVAVRPRRPTRRLLGSADQRRGDGESDGARGGARGAPARAAGPGSRSARCGPGGRACLCERPNALLGRPRARHPRLPGGHAASGPVGRAVPALGGPGCGRHRGRSCGRADTPGGLCRRGIDEHRIRGRRARPGVAREGRGLLAPRGCRLRRGRPSVPARRRARARPRARGLDHDRPAQMVLPGL